MTRLFNLKRKKRDPSCGSLVYISFEIIITSIHHVHPLQMLPEIICPRPFLVFFAATLNDAPIVFATSIVLRMTASFVPIDIVRCAEAFSAYTTGDVAVVGLLVFLLVLSSGSS